MIETAPPNSCGCVQVSAWVEDFGGRPLDEQLRAAGIEYAMRPFSSLAGFAGSARLVHYTSPNTGAELTVLCIPRLVAADAQLEDYYYFPRAVWTLHQDEAWWIAAYDELSRLYRGGVIAAPTE